MRISSISITILLITIFISCNSSDVNTSTPLTKEQLLAQNIKSLKDSAKEGDLLVRLSDELISERVRYLNEKDFSFSHSGVIVNYKNQKMVCNINPDIAGADTVKYEPIDSFINPKKNIVCGLFRYNLAANQAAQFVGGLNNYHAQKIRFDNLYNLATDSVLYCTEMIYKAIDKIDGKPLKIKRCLIPKRALPMVYMFFKGKASNEEIQKREFISLDNLYLIPQCREVMRFKLKIFPGE